MTKAIKTFVDFYSAVCGKLTISGTKMHAAHGWMMYRVLGKTFRARKTVDGHQVELCAMSGNVTVWELIGYFDTLTNGKDHMLLKVIEMSKGDQAAQKWLEDYSRYQKSQA